MNESPSSPAPIRSDVPETRISRLAIASLVLGILSFTFNITASIPAVICGLLALGRIKYSNGQVTGSGLAISGIVMSVLFALVLPVILLSILMMPALSRPREGAQREACQHNLKQMGLVLKMYAKESRGMNFPALSSAPGKLMFSTNDVYPKFLLDLSWLVCPGDSYDTDTRGVSNRAADATVGDQSYVYLGYVITREEELEAFAEVYQQRVAQGLPFDEDLKAPAGRGSMGSDTFFRLREGVERLFITDVNDPAAGSKMQSLIPVMWDRVENISGEPMFKHSPEGLNILFMDGHIEFKRYPGSWPVTADAPELFSEIEALGR